ncbi:MAG: rod shape-determining protein MreD [Acidimicrobiaceae bacterium]|jgi:rod shape-determining protein MreD|nr:rod shape-determining protein MreD [Acidimicrobiaceae bacterium]
MVAAIVSPAVATRLRVAALLVLALLLQTTVVADLRILGVCADMMLLCTVSAAVVGGPELGGVVGFAAGLLADLFLVTTPLGLSALVFSLIGYGVGSIRGTVLQEGWFLAPATAFVASAAGVVTFVLAGVMVGQSQLTAMGPVAIVKTALIVGVMNGIVAAPVTRLFAWAASGAKRSDGGGSGGEMSSLATRQTSRMTSGHFGGGVGYRGPTGSASRSARR